MPSSPVNHGPSPKGSGGNPGALPFTQFALLWEEAGKRNAIRRSYTEDHGPGWWVSAEESDAIRIGLHAAKVADKARRSFGQYYGAYFEVWAVYADGIPRLQSAPRK